MDVSVQYVDPVKEDLISPDDWGQLWSNYKQGSSTMGCLVAELGAALEDALVLLSTSAPPLEGCEVCYLEKDTDCEEVVIDQDESLNLTPQEKLLEHVMLQWSRNMLLCDAPARGKDKRLNTALAGVTEPSSSEPVNPTRSSIMSVPVSLKLVSAMKGSREKQGLQVEKLSVKWAPDVYDPPTTSQSHSMKSFNQHYSSKTSKKSHRHKHKGAKGVDKKQRRKNAKSSSKVASY